MNGITRADIFKKLPYLPKGSIDLMLARAGVTYIGIRPNKLRPHICEYIYPSDTIERLKVVINKR
jgi:hypothetical protein